MAIDVVTRLAQTLAASPGVYAVLIGSGVSTEAGILTGWGIVLDLITRVAVAGGEAEPEDPEGWWGERYGTEPNYSELLEQLGGTPTERQAVLNGYFEPDDDDRAAGGKVPTEAHRALAVLASSGVVRVFVTTNFDRLLEQALDEVGVPYRVATVGDSIRALPPLQHAGVVVLKIHGDYRDTRIKNTRAELAAYEPDVVTLLTRIFGEYGLIVCGWSAQWDDGLRALLESARCLHYTTFWAHRGTLTSDAEGVVAARIAQTISVTSASMFFDDLATRVLAIAEASAADRIDVEGAVAMAKRYVADPIHRIRLHDFVERQLRRALDSLGERALPLTSEPPEDELRQAIMHAEQSIDVLAHVVGIGCAWGEDADARSMWVRVLRRLSQVEDPPGGRYFPALEKLRRYPALQYLYAAGIGALATDRYETLVALLQDGGSVRFERYEMPLIYSVNESNAASGLEVFATGAARLTATSDRLHELTAVRLRDVVSDADRFTDLFDRFEYIVGLCVFGVSGSGWGSTGAFRRRFHDEALNESMRGDQSGSHPMQVLRAEEETLGSQHPLLRAGLFGGSLERLREVQDGYVVQIRRAAPEDEYQLRAR